MSTPPSLTLSVVIPAYNEEANIRIVVEDCIAKLDSTDLRAQYELLVVDDGSTDGSARVAQTLAAEHAAVVAVQRSVNGGMGAALRTGYVQTRGTYVSFCPSDGEVKIDEVLRLYTQIGTADLIVGQRGIYRGEPQRKRPLHRRLLSASYQTAAKLLVGVNPATLSGLYLIKGEFLRSLPLSCNTGNLVIEIFRHALRAGKAIEYSETFISPRISGVSKVANMRTSLETLGELVRLRLSA